MADVAYENATKRLAEIQVKMRQLADEVHSLSAEERDIKQFLDSWAKFAGEPTLMVTDLPSIRHKNLSPKRRRRTVGNTKKEVVLQSAEMILHEAGRPLSRSELLDSLVRGGAVIEGSDPGNVLATMLTRTDGQIKLIKGLGYWFKDRPYEPNGYFPHSSEA